MTAEENHRRKEPRSIARSGLALFAWLAITFLAPAVGAFSAPGTGEFYSSLEKPSWSPPPWIFGPVWTALYILMAVAMWRVWMRSEGSRRGPTTAYLVQLALNALWTPLFFGIRRPDLALIDIVLLLIAIVVTMVAFRRHDRAASALLAPYLVWVAFATALNFTLWRMN